jgi:DNA (cytosine-5)-methyltransferase 1
MGYHRVGFDVVGVDIEPQPHYPFEFRQMDALAVLRACIGPLEFDAIHASPPCQAYSVSTPDRSKHPDLYDEVRTLLEATGLPWVIENVPGAPYRSGVTLCGGMFDLPVKRHRNFETSFLILQPHHRCPEEPWAVTGHSNGKGRVTAKHRDPSTHVGLMDCDWMTWKEATQAIPPPYTTWIGTQLLQHLKVTTDAH